MQCFKCGNEFNPDLKECPVCAIAQKKSWKAVQFFEKAEDLIIELLLGAIIFIVLAQIFLRNIYQSGIMGGDELIRHLVLWIAFFGAAIATRSRAHVKIGSAFPSARTCRKLPDLVRCWARPFFHLSGL